MKRFFATILSFLAVATANFVASAVEKYDFLHIDKASSGLSYDGVRIAFEDSRGFIWIGTYKGLCRFDGFRIVSYDHDDFGTSSDFISFLEEDSDGNIWVGTDNGIVVYDYTQDLFTPLKIPGKPGDRVYSIKHDSAGDVWFGMRNSGLFRYRRSDGSVECILESNPAGLKIVPYRIVIGKNSDIWIASYCDDIYCLSGDELTPVTDSFFEGDDVEGLDMDENGMLWIASKRNGLCRLNPHTGAVSVVVTLKEDVRPTNLKCNGTYVWLSTTNGLVRYNQVDSEKLFIHNDSEDAFSISDDFVTSAFVSSTGVLWVTTETGGVNFSNPQSDAFRKFYKLSSGESLSGSVIKDFAQDSFGRVWVGTHTRGLLRLDVGAGILEQYKGNADVPTNINALISDGDFLWIGSNNGLCRMNVRTGKTKKYTNFFSNEPENRIINLYRSRDEMLYCCTPIGVCRYDKSSDTFTGLAALSGITVEDIAQDASGLMYLASYSQGAYAYDAVKDSLVAAFCRTDGKSVIPEMTSSMAVDSDGTPWIIGFSSGFFAREGEDFREFSKATVPALPTDIYLAGEFDSEKNLWLSTDVGLVEFNPSSADARLYTKADGLFENKFTLNASLKLLDGRMLFGNDNGFILFNPAEAASNLHNGRITICGARINGEPRRGQGNIDLVSELVLTSEERSLGFDFTEQGMAGMVGVKIFCRLSGFEEEWRDISSTGSVDYFNLPAGRYVLEVGQALPGEDIRLSRTMNVIVRPTFIESPFGMTCIILCALLAAFLISFYIYRNALSKQKKKHKEKELTLKEQLYHEKMGFFANVIHEIKTPLTLLRTPLSNLMDGTSSEEDRREDLRIIGNSASYMEKLVKELLEFISLEEHGYVIERRNVNMTERIGFILSNYKELAKSRELSLTYKSTEEEIICAVDGKALSKIVNNLLQNAMKFGRSYVDVELAKADGMLKIFFRNDGGIIPAGRRKEIFKPFVYYSSPENQSFGIGLPFARKLSELHGGTLVLSERTDCNEFVLSLPLQTVPDAGTAVEENDNTGELLIPASNLPLLLIVEDNEDMLGYLKRKLYADFKVIGVNSGEAAIEKIQKHMIDLVITDIGLPNMSGVELCAKINGNPHTAHIPIIVLSAISSLPTKVQCMENGASMFIEKPFSLDYLVSCVNSLMTKRKFMRNAYAPKVDAIEKVQANLPDRDNDFVLKLNKVIAENISNPKLNNTFIENTLFISHSSLNRKMRQLLNTTPNDYIRRKRLDLGAQMLKRGGARVNEICYAVGFNSPSYFAKCFKEEYGVLPADYADGKNLAFSETEVQ